MSLGLKKKLGLGGTYNGEVLGKSNESKYKNLRLSGSDYRFIAAGAMLSFFLTIAPFVLPYSIKFIKDGRRQESTSDISKTLTSDISEIMMLSTTENQPRYNPDFQDPNESDLISSK
jgi:hypothetical protein